LYVVTIFGAFYSAILSFGWVSFLVADKPVVAELCHYDVS
jgi:hypothetical protein